MITEACLSLKNWCQLTGERFKKGLLSSQCSLERMTENGRRSMVAVRHEVSGVEYEVEEL